MPNVYLTKAMQEFAEAQIEAGLYSNLSEVVREGMRLLMEKNRATFFVLKAELEEAIAAAERGEYVEFDPRLFEPRAFR